jgi:hypothetical protein
LSKFLNGCDLTQVAANRKEIFYMVDFDIPDRIADQIPHEAIGILKMGFYTDPPLGSTIKRLGHRWKVADIEFEPTRYYSREVKLIPTIKTEYLGTE